MRVAVVADLHGNAPALRAVIRDVERHQPNVVVCCGDIAAGPLPCDTLEELRRIDDLVAVRGNADRESVEVFDGLSVDEAPPDSRWAGKQITESQRDWLAGLPRTATIECDRLGTVVFCHGTPRDDSEIVLETTPADQLLDKIADVDADVIVCGNTHMQFDRTVGDYRVVNAGSVGMPYGRTGAFWCLLDGDVQLLRTDYDLAEAARTIRQRSRWELVDSFAEDNVLTVPSKSEALATFEALS